MRKIIVIPLLLCCFCAVYSQDCFDKLAKQAVVIDSLQKVIKAERESVGNQSVVYQNTLKSQRDTIKSLKSDLSKLEKFKADKKIIDAQLKQKNDSIVLLKNHISGKEQQITAEKQKCEQKLHEEKEKGKNEVLANIVNSYKNNKFDDLIKSSTKPAVRRDMQLVGNNMEMEVKQILSDLEKYFDAEELLAKKFDAAQIGKAQLQLNQIKQPSKLLDKLKENIEYYKDFSDKLKERVENLVELDKQKVAVDSETRKMKFQLIVTELSNYMYDYDEYGNYPYLSDIVLEIIKRKKSNADADIRDLLIRLQ